MSSFRISEALVLSVMVAGGALGLGACGGGGATNGSGGASGSGGAASGGKIGSGGATGSGGTSGSGGAASTGSGGAASGGSGSGGSGSGGSGSGGLGSGGQAATGGVTGSGGQSASGGQPGSGGAGGGTGPGSGGATSSGGAGGGSGGPGGCLICDDFESSTGLDAAKWVVDASMGAAAGKAEIVTSGAHGSGKAVKVSGGYIKIDAKAELFAKVPVHFFIRVSMKFDMPQPSGHVTYMMLADKTKMGQLRIGAQNGGMIWNYDSTDSILPDFNAAAMSLKPAANEWHCFEFEIDGTAPAMRAWMDGTESPQMLYDATPTAGIDDRWMKDMPGWKPSITSFSFGAGYPVGSLSTWYDDIAISGTRVGCP